MPLFQLQHHTFFLLLLLLFTALFSASYGGEICNDQFGGYCSTKEGRGCCQHGQPMCCGAGHSACIPRLGHNLTEKCPGSVEECPPSNVCLLLGGPGKDKCVPKEVEVCKQYLNYETQTRCGDNGYPLAYGLKYCTGFFQHYDQFNGDGQKFIKCVGGCLVRKMPEAVHNASGDCTTLKTAAYDSHTPCYIDCGFTNNSVWLGNIRQFSKVLDTKDLLSHEGLRQVNNIIMDKIGHGLKTVTDLLQYVRH